MRLSCLVVGLVLCSARPARAQSECASPSADWLFCEDFEKGGLGFGPWFAQSPFVECLGCSAGNTQNPNRILLTQDATRVFRGGWALHMPAEAAAQYQGAALVYRSCTSNKQPGCALTNHDQLFFRSYVRLDPDHQEVHHFMALSGSRPNAYWESDGNAGCRPNGVRSAGTTVDFNQSHELFFYTYSPGMSCDSGGYCSGTYAQNICTGCAAKDMPCTNGLECCWGNLTRPTPPVVLERGKWVCLEMMMKLNTVGQANGEMTFWVDGTLGVQKTGMSWRTVPELGLNKVFVQHYLDVGDATQSNRISWDNLVASTSRIGCLGSLPTVDAGSGSTDAGPVDAGLADAGGGSTDAGAPDAGRADGGGSGLTDGGGAPGPVSSGCGCGHGGAAGFIGFGGLALLALLGARRSPLARVE